MSRNPCEISAKSVPARSTHQWAHHPISLGPTGAEIFAAFTYLVARNSSIGTPHRHTYTGWCAQEITVTPCLGHWAVRSRILHGGATGRRRTILSVSVVTSETVGQVDSILRSGNVALTGVRVLGKCARGFSSSGLRPELFARRLDSGLPTEGFSYNFPGESFLLGWIFKNILNWKKGTGKKYIL